jgi:ribosomal protein S27E
MYEPLQVSKCEKCGTIIAEPKELIKIVKEMPRE